MSELEVELKIVKPTTFSLMNLYLYKGTSGFFLLIFLLLIIFLSTTSLGPGSRFKLPGFNTQLYWRDCGQATQPL